MIRRASQCERPSDGPGSPADPGAPTAPSLSAIRPCPFVQDLLPRYIDSALEAQGVTLVSEHLARCPVCREVKDRLVREQLELLESLMPASPPLPASFARKVTGAISREERRRARQRRRLRVRFLTGLAAGLLLGAILVLVSSRWWSSPVNTPVASSTSALDARARAGRASPGPSDRSAEVALAARPGERSARFGGDSVDPVPAREKAGVVLAATGASARSGTASAGHALSTPPGRYLEETIDMARTIDEVHDSVGMETPCTSDFNQDQVTDVSEVALAVMNVFSDQVDLDPDCQSVCSL